MSPNEFASLRHDTTKKEPRRIVQIAAIQESSQCGTQIIALCNDGTAWWRFDLIEAPWNQLPEIPQ